VLLLDGTFFLRHRGAGRLGLNRRSAGWLRARLYGGCRFVTGWQSGRLRTHRRGAGRFCCRYGRGRFLLPRRYHALAGELARFGRRGNRRPAMVFGCEQSFVSACRSLVLELRRNGGYVLLVRGGLFFWCWPGRRSTAATIEANPYCARLNDDGLFINIGDRNAAKIVDCPIVSKHAIFPTSTLVPDAAIPEAVVDSAVKADVGPQ